MHGTEINPESTRGGAGALQLGHSGHNKQEKHCQGGGQIGPGVGTEGGRHMGANGLLPSTTMLNFAIFCHFWVLIVVHKA